MNTALLYATLFLALGLACCILEFTKYVKTRRYAVIVFVIYGLFGFVVMYSSLYKTLDSYHRCFYNIQTCLAVGKTDGVIEAIDIYLENFRSARDNDKHLRAAWTLDQQLYKVWLQPPQNTEQQDQPANEREVPSE